MQTISLAYQGLLATSVAISVFLIAASLCVIAFVLMRRSGQSRSVGPPTPEDFGEVGMTSRELSTTSTVLICEIAGDGAHRGAKTLESLLDSIDRFAEAENVSISSLTPFGERWASDGSVWYEAVALRHSARPRKTW
ncbi:MAG: hypothetical protein WC763_04280 [Candidatus Paceibacterota bacterium]|jgi:hypothetical protein